MLFDYRHTWDSREMSLFVIWIWTRINQQAWKKNQTEYYWLTFKVIHPRHSAINKLTWILNEFISYPPLLCIWLWIISKWRDESSASFEPICPNLIDSIDILIIIICYRKALNSYPCARNLLDFLSWIYLFVFSGDDEFVVWDSVAGCSMKIIES